MSDELSIKDVRASAESSSTYIKINDGETVTLTYSDWVLKEKQWDNDDKPKPIVECLVSLRGTEPVSMTHTVQGILLREMLDLFEKHDEDRQLKVTIKRSGTGKDTRYVVMEQDTK